VAGCRGSELFTSRELFEQNEPALRIVLAGLNARSLGRLLRRAEDESVEGYVVRREGSNAPTSPPTAATTYCSLFQNNLVGVRVLSWLGWRRAVPGSVAYMVTSY